jgi:hypothetical protein
MPRKPSPPSIDQIVALLDHPRAQVEWVVRAALDSIAAAVVHAEEGAP